MHYDVVVIGGGINGVGTAQAAAAAGYSVMLLEKSALAAGTSSRSSKLIHGGLRYLESGRFRLVRESLREREILLRIAPDLVKLVPFYVPIYRTTRRRPWQITVGLSLYALLGGFSNDNRFDKIARSAWSTLDGIDTRDLQAVFRYYDGQTDDAVLTRAVMRSAQSLGAELIAPAEFVAARRAANGWEINYVAGGRTETCAATVIVNASGPWANDVLARVAPSPPQFTIELVQGTHIVIDTSTQRGIYYVEANDGRAVFVMPWHGRTLVGTTELSYRDDPARASPTREEVNYLQETFSRHFPKKVARIAESFAGLRVLPAADRSMFYRSRETVFYPDHAQRPTLITIYGGKLTAYRLTAARALEHLRGTLSARRARASTEKLPLRDA